MARVTVEDCLETVPNRFALVHLVAKRSKQLLKGASMTSATKPGNKYIVNSLREVASGSVHFDTPNIDEALTQEILRQSNSEE